MVGLTAYFVLNVFVDEVKPGVRQAMEDTLVDSANILAALASADMQSGHINDGSFANALEHYQQETPHANIWGIIKSNADYRVYITDTHGIVVFDSAHLALGQDYSKWNDVYLTLRGRYGARSSPAVDGSPDRQDTIMYVAAPVKHGNEIIGALTVAKANRTMQPFIERAQQKIVSRGWWLVFISLLLGLLFTWRFTRAIHRLRDYAIAVANGAKAPKPDSSNDELAELANAMHTMRQQLDGKQYVQDYIHHVTHELKSPITAIQASADLITPNMPQQDQTHFLNTIREQTLRLHQLVQNLLGLAAIEHQDQLQQVSAFSLNQLMSAQIALCEGGSQRKQIKLAWHAEEKGDVVGDAFLLGQAILNLLENALDFSPPHSCIKVTLNSLPHAWEIIVQDEGVGIPDYAVSKIFDKFYSLPRPDSGKKSTGLGLNFVREVAHLHGGEVTLTNLVTGGVQAKLTIKR